MNTLFAVASTVSGGSTDRAIAASFDDGVSFTPIITPSSESYVGAAASPDRNEVLFLTSDGIIQRTTDGVTVAPLANDLGSASWRSIARNDGVGLYVAVGVDPVDTTHRIATSPDGVTWTRLVAPVLTYAVIAAFDDIVLAGSSAGSTRPAAESADYATFSQIAAMGFSAPISGIARDASDAFMFSSLGLTATIHADPTLTTFVQIGGLPNGQHAIAYDPVTDLYVTSASTGSGTYTSPAAVPAWTLRGVGLHYEDVLAFTAKPGGGFVGLRTISGSETLPRILDTTDGVAWTQAAPGLATSSTWSTLVYLVLPTFTVPDVIGFTIGAATSAIVAAGFILGTVSTQETNDFPANSVLSQFPLGGTEAAAGAAVSVTIAVPNPRVVPDVIGLSLADAEIAIRAAGFLVGVTTVTTEPLGPLGTVVFQSPPGGSTANPGTKVALTSTALLQPFDVDATVISQYSNSPTINRLVENMADYIDPAVDMTNFYNLVWNVDTAVGFGLDIWGDIVGVSRLLRLPSDDPIFGYINEDDPPDWYPFNEGIFTPGAQASQAYLLPDDSFRTLILTKALSNIVATSAASLNQLLRNLFPGRGKAYVVDLGGMAMRFVFEFVLTSTEFAILTQSNALPHPAGVSYSVVVVATETFGFAEAGSTSLPFDFGVFYLPPA